MLGLALLLVQLRDLTKPDYSLYKPSWGRLYPII